MSGTKRLQIKNDYTISAKKIKNNERTSNIWNDLKHRGPLFTSLKYIPLPKDVLFKYDGKEVHLSQAAEEMAYCYAKVYKKYTEDKVFQVNFFNDWCKYMINEEKILIQDLSKCDFKSMAAHYKRTKNDTELLENEYAYCYIDGRREKVKNYKITSPRLFEGRGEHPKRGRIIKRVMPEDVLINCSENKEPNPPTGHDWKEVRQNKTVQWLASWEHNVTGETIFMEFSDSSKLKGERSFQKFETARELHKYIHKIRDEYRQDWRSNDRQVCQRAVALYLIDRLALRAGNYKGNDKADTVGCSSLRNEHVKLNESKCEAELSFLGKDSIEYKRKFQIEKEVFEKLKQFKESKGRTDDLFDEINTQTLNTYLQKKFMPRLTIKVFRTYNASILLENNLHEYTPKGYTDAKKIFLKTAIRAVAKLCNHKHTVNKNGSKKQDYANNTSKLNYIDPRIIVAWCKKHNISIEEIYTEAQRNKFNWAIDMADENFKFAAPPADNIDHANSYNDYVKENQDEPFKIKSSHNLLGHANRQEDNCLKKTTILDYFLPSK